MMQRDTKSTKKVCRSLQTETLFVIQLIVNKEGKGSGQDNSDLFTFSPKVRLNRLMNHLTTCLKNLEDLGLKQSNNPRLIVVSATTVTCYIQNRENSRA